MEKFKLKVDEKYVTYVTLFPKVIGSDDKGTVVSIEDVINTTSTPEHDAATRRVGTIENKKTRDRYKKKFPCVAPAVLLEGGAEIKHILQWTNLMLIDTDFLNSNVAKEKFPVIAEILKEHLIYQRYSISLTGIHTLILIENREKRLEYLDSINDHFKKFGFEIDLQFRNPVQKAILSPSINQILNDAPIAFDGRFKETGAIITERESIQQRSSGEKKKKVNPYAESIKYLSQKYKVVRDSLSGKVTVNGELLNENIISTMIMDAVLNGFFANKEFISHWVSSRFVQVTNRFDELVKKYSHLLNSTGHITKLASSLVVISVPPSYPNFVQDTLRLWLVKMVAQLYERKANDIAIFLVGPQNIGKTSFFQFLLPLELRDLYVEAAFKNDREYKALLIKNILVVDDELKSRIQDIEFVKSTLTNPYVFHRKLYVEDGFSYPRLATFGGTSNDQQMLADPSGNRRFVILQISKIERSVYESVDKAALLLEAYTLYRNGFNLETPDDLVKAIQLNSHQFEVLSVAEEILIDKFPPANPDVDPRNIWHWWPVSHLVKVVNEERNPKIKEFHVGVALKKLKYVSKYMQVGPSKLRVYAIRPTNGMEWGHIIDCDVNDLPPLE